MFCPHLSRGFLGCTQCPPKVILKTAEGGLLPGTFLEDCLRPPPFGEEKGGLQRCQRTRPRNTTLEHARRTSCCGGRTTPLACVSIWQPPFCRVGGGSGSLCYLKTSLPEVGHLMQPPPLGAPLGAPSPTPAVQKGSRGQCALECGCPTALCPSSFQNMGRGRWAGGGWCSASKEGTFGTAKWRDGRLPRYHQTLA